ncbi:MAG: cytochrome c3 family protein [Thermodesulfobacteriota bacterium]
MPDRPRTLAPLTTLVFLSLLLAAPSGGRAYENEECMDCHGDKDLTRSASEGMRQSLWVDYEKFKYSIHNINAIACNDCHGIETLDLEQDPPHPTSTAAVRCFGCHEEEGEAYKNSVHYQMSSRGVSIPCFACHEYHYTSRLEVSTVSQRENNFCLKCHEPSKFHDWLPQKETHFAHVECVVCHAPDAPRHIDLEFYDLVRERFLTTAEKLEALQTDADGFVDLLDRDGNGILDMKEFEDMVLVMRQRGVRGTFRGELLSEVQPVVHHVKRGEAKRSCETCHMPTSPFFAEVNITLKHDDGTVTHLPVERRVLESYYVNHFYALGGTRVRILDKIGFLLPVGGVLVVGLHLGARIATAPRRRKEKGRTQRDRR